MRKNDKKETFVCPSVYIVGVDTIELMAGSNPNAKRNLSIDADFTDGDNVDATSGTTDVNHTGKTSGGTNIFGY